MAAHLTFASHFNRQVQKLLEKEVSVVLELIFPKIKQCKCSGKNICFRDLSTSQNVFVLLDRNSHISYNSGISFLIIVPVTVLLHCLTLK